MGYQDQRQTDLINLVKGAKQVEEITEEKGWSEEVGEESSHGI